MSMPSPVVQIPYDSAKLNALPTNAELTASLAAKADLTGALVPVAQLPAATASAKGALAAADYTMLKVGLPKIQTVQGKAKAGLTDAQTCILPDGTTLAYRFPAEFTPSQAPTIDVDISGASTAGAVAALLVAAVPGAATVTVTTDVNGLMTITAKTPGSAGNVAVTGTGIGTVTNTQYGLDALLTATMIKALQDLLTP